MINICIVSPYGRNPASQFCDSGACAVATPRHQARMHDENDVFDEVDLNL